MSDNEFNDFNEFDDLKPKGKYPTKLVVIALSCVVLFFVLYILIDSNSNKELNDDIADCIATGVIEQDKNNVFTSVKCYYKYDEFSEVKLNQKIFYCYVNNDQTNYYQGTYYIDSNEWKFATGSKVIKGICE